MKLKEILTGKHSRFILCALLIFFIGLSVSAERSARTITSTGTGFIVSSEGYILTNEHVIHGATKVTVTLEGQDYKAEVVQDDPNKDIALLKVEGHGLPTVRLGDSDALQITDQVIAIGCPRQICGTVTQGEVANLPNNFIMMDLTLASGSSGGPLLNEKGEVIGINTSVVPFGGSEERAKMPSGFSLAIPINQAIPLLRYIPRFKLSQMGSASEKLAIDEIVHQVSPALVYIQATLNYQELLPDPKSMPRFEESKDKESYINEAVNEVVNRLEKRGFSVRGGAAIPVINPDRGYWGWIELFAFSNNNAPSQAINSLLKMYKETARNYRLGEFHTLRKGNLGDLGQYWMKKNSQSNWLCTERSSFHSLASPCNHYTLQKKINLIARAVLVIKNLAIRVDLKWSDPSSLPLLLSSAANHVWENGKVMRENVKTDAVSEVISIDEFAQIFKQLTELSAATIKHKLSSK